MGTELSTPLDTNEYKEKENCTDAQIEERIRNVFFDSKLDDMETSEAAMHGGFLSNTNEQLWQGQDQGYEQEQRYKQYDLRNILPRIQDGGNIDDLLSEVPQDANYQNLSEELTSEFERIRQYMVNESQKGGNVSESVTTDAYKEINLIDLFGRNNATDYLEQINREIEGQQGGAASSSSPSVSASVSASTSASVSAYVPSASASVSASTSVSEGDVTSSVVEQSKDSPSDSSSSTIDDSDDDDVAGSAVLIESGFSVSSSTISKDTSETTDASEDSTTSSAQVSFNTYSKTSNNNDGSSTDGARPFSSTDTHEFSLNQPSSRGRFD